MKRLSQDLLVTLFGALSSLLAAIVLAYCELQLNVAIYSFTAWLIIPIGAIGAGFVAASGYYIGSRIFNHKPDKTILLSMVMISFATYFLFNFLIFAFISRSF